MENDRPPVVGVVGRSFGQIRLEVHDNTKQKNLQEQVEKHTLSTTILNTDEWIGYARICETGREHRVVCHSIGEWARDDDGAVGAHLGSLDGVHLDQTSPVMLGTLAARFPGDDRPGELWQRVRQVVA